MSILDAITNAAERHPEVNEQQHSSLVSSATQMFGNSGELSGLFNHAESQGLGHIVGSWIGTGSNHWLIVRVFRLLSLVQLWLAFCQCSLIS